MRIFVWSLSACITYFGNMVITLCNDGRDYRVFFLQTKE